MASSTQLKNEIRLDGRYGAGIQGKCALGPIPGLKNAPEVGCGRAVTPIVADGRDGRGWDEPPEGMGEGFRDLLSLREWQVTGMCQRCQDDMERAEVHMEDLSPDEDPWQPER